MTKIFQKVVFGFAIACLTACASYRWEKPGATQQDFAKDSYECERDARQSGYFGGGIMGAINFSNFQERCLVAKGYTKINTDNSASLRETLPQSQRSPQPIVPQQTPPVATPLPSMPQQGERQPVAPSQPAVLQQQRKAKLDVVQIQNHYDNDDRVCLLSTPDIHSKKLGRIYSGVKFKVLEEKEAWLFIESPFGRRGWILKEWIQE